MRENVTIFVAAALLLSVCGPGSGAEDAESSDAGSAGVTAAANQTPFGMLRDPFWPIGWRPADLGRVSKLDGTDQSGLIKWRQAARKLKLSGISKAKGGKFLAVLKGAGVIEEGDTISVNHNGLTYKWVVRSITAEGMVPEKVGVYPMK